MVTVMVVLAGVSLVASTPATASGGTQSPLDALPRGRAPRAVPYAIGTIVYYQGHRTDIRARFKKDLPGNTVAQRQLTTVVAGGGYAWAQLSGPATDMAHIVGRISPSGGWRGLQASTGAMSKVAVTPSGTVALPESGRLFRADGRQIGAYCGGYYLICGFLDLGAAGSRFVVQKRPSMPGVPHGGTWLWAPPAAPTQIGDGYRAVGRLGAGWVAAPDGGSPGAACWRVAPASAPTAVRARICSAALPLVSADGERAVIVQAERVRVVDTRTGNGISLARIALPAWSPNPTTGALRGYLVPTAWESTDSYLVNARDGRVLALVRCSASTGRCERAVRALSRTGATRIVTERGAEELEPMQ